MKSAEFKRIRKKLGKTQKELAELLGISLKTIHSYEQDLRRIPAHAERQSLFLLFRKIGKEKQQKPCWTIKKCPTFRKKECPAWEFRAGKLCWFINGTICECKAKVNWRDKIKVCRECEVFLSVLGNP